MLKRSVLFSFFLLFVSSSVFADITVKLDSGVSLLTVNGTEPRQNRFFEKTNQIVLDDGVNQLLIQYTAEIKTSSSDYELETTDPHVILIEASDTSINLEVPKVRTMADLERFNTEGRWLITDIDGTAVYFEKEVLRKEGFQLSRDYERELELFNRSKSPAALKLAVDNYTPVGVGPVSKSPAVNSSNNMPGEMLRYWYNQADKETRKVFKAWIK